MPYFISYNQNVKHNKLTIKLSNKDKDESLMNEMSCYLVDLADSY